MYATASFTALRPDASRGSGAARGVALPLSVGVSPSPAPAAPSGAGLSGSSEDEPPIGTGVAAPRLVAGAIAAT